MFLLGEYYEDEAREIADRLKDVGMKVDIRMVTTSYLDVEHFLEGRMSQLKGKLEEEDYARYERYLAVLRKVLSEGAGPDDLPERIEMEMDPQIDEKKKQLAEELLFNIDLTEEELHPLVTAWRSANPHIVRFWWDVDRAVMRAVREHISSEVRGIRFSWQSGMLFITLPSGRKLTYIKPRIGMNQFGSDCVTYEGVGSTKQWERLESYGPKFVENITQATSRDILCYAMKTLRCCNIVAHIHDEVVIDADKRMSLEAVCEQMGRTPPWAPGLKLRADGFECNFYKKD